MNKDIIRLICQKLNDKDVFSMIQTCKYFYDAIDKEFFWKERFNTRFLKLNNIKNYKKYYADTANEILSIPYKLDDRNLYYVSILTDLLLTKFIKKMREHNFSTKEDIENYFFFYTKDLKYENLYIKAKVDKCNFSIDFGVKKHLVSIIDYLFTTIIEKSPQDILQNVISEKHIYGFFF